MYKKVYNTTPGFCGINEIKQSAIYATVNDNVAWHKVKVKFQVTA